ncbi:hypothetical protein GGX14DRAFT_563165 [Mycena pura]|uniref:Uncharacterized protein n=1 Tax=Mycena pura TaxID=153505 RepID=A0AAD6YDZ9_9AGAR|nr:hypothetical protein GGX14DRAFT_563165 [Mycena pura]
MADDAPLTKKGRGGFRERAGRPKGSKNKPKVSLPAAAAAAPAPAPPCASVQPRETAAKRRPADKVFSGFKSASRRIANFWTTRAPQGTHGMDTESIPEQPPSGFVSAHNVITRLHEEMQAADVPVLASEQVFQETVEDPEQDDAGAALLDETDDRDEDNEDGLDEEQERAEAAVDSPNEQWLRTTLEKLKKDITDDKPPRIYRDGQLWIYPRDPIFALQCAATEEIYCPDALYQLPIFVWLPDYLPGHPDRFICECGEFLNKHSWNTKPIARRVCTTSGSDYFLLTKRHYCPHRNGNTRGCGKTYQGTDPWILAQLPRFVQDRFPVAISHRSAVDLSQMDMMKITFAGRFGPDPFSKMVRELKYLRHSRLEAMYLHAALHYGLRGPKIPLFSPFHDAMGFAGYAPSTKYLKSMFIAWFTSHRILLQTVDHQGRLPGGEPIHTALYDALNTDEEVRFYGLTLTQSFAPLEGMYERVQIELPRHGHKPTEAVFCDNPRSERSWHERVTPSLKCDVQHIVVNPFRDLPEFRSSTTEPMFASSPNRIDTLCDDIIRSLPADDSLYLTLSLSLNGDHIRAVLLRTESMILVLDARFKPLSRASLPHLRAHPSPDR